MDDPISRARDFTELRDLGEHGPYLFTRMFSVEGWWARSRAKRRLALLKRIDQPLRAMLHEDERVFFLTRGVAQPSMLEWYLLGAPLYYLNRRALVFTNRRILLIQIDWRNRVREMRDEISYGVISRLERTLFGYLRIRFKSGELLRLAAVPRADRRWLSATFERLPSALEAAPTREGLQHLCPRCYAHLRTHVPACPTCQGALKAPKTAAILSFLFPGAGDLYLGHRSFAYLEILFASLIWVLALVIAFDLTVGLRDLALLFGITIPAIHGFDAFTTHRIATQGILPHDGRPARRRLLLSGLVPALVLVCLGSTLPYRLQLRPVPGVMTGAELPSAYQTALQREGYLQPGEAVRFFHSAGRGSVLQEGSLFTDDRVVSYASTDQGMWWESARLSEIVDLDFALAPPTEPLSYITVVREDGVGFLLSASTLDGGDQEFSVALLDRWLAVRHATSGSWFDGGSGYAPADAVIVRGARDAQSADSLQHWWLRTWHGEEGTEWRVLDRLEHAEEALREWRLAFSDGGEASVFFRVADTP